MTQYTLAATIAIIADKLSSLPAAESRWGQGAVSYFLDTNHPETGAEFYREVALQGAGDAGDLAADIDQAFAAAIAAEYMAWLADDAASDTAEAVSL
jgi:hypothetical protein